MITHITHNDGKELIKIRHLQDEKYKVERYKFMSKFIEIQVYKSDLKVKVNAEFKEFFQKYKIRYIKTNCSLMIGNISFLRGMVQELFIETIQISRLQKIDKELDYTIQKIMIKFYKNSEFEDLFNYCKKNIQNVKPKYRSIFDKNNIVQKVDEDVIVFKPKDSTDAINGIARAKIDNINDLYNKKLEIAMLPFNEQEFNTVKETKHVILQDKHIKYIVQGIINDESLSKKQATDEIMLIIDEVRK